MPTNPDLDKLSAAATQGEWENHGDEMQIDREGMREAFETLRREATMLCQNSMACAANHYGEDFAQHGMPQWLADSQARIQSASAAITAILGGAK